MPDLAIISADSHCNEPAEIYQRLPEEYRARAPHEGLIDGKRYLIYEGQRPSPMEAPHPLTEDDMRRYWRDGEELGRVQHRAGGTHIPTRLADQEVDGVTAEVVYPQAIFKLFSSPDPGYQLALARLYNDWHHEIFGGYPDKFVVSAQIPMIDINDGIAEARRAAKLGYRSFSLPVIMPMLPYNMPDYEPFWTAVEDLGVPVAFHVFTGGPGAEPATQEPYEIRNGVDQLGQVLGMTAAMYPMVQLIASGACQRHPGLKFVLAEAGIGWLPWLLVQMDDNHHRRHMWEVPQLELLPSEYFKRQGYSTFADDIVGIMTREFTGVDSLMWGSDYPHDEGTFPHSQEVIERTFKDVSEEDKRKIVCGNAARLYGFRLN
ncbi:MAG: amidohydrolase [Chloroflexi bacterium]|nr:amidohydrolase [Chloroflexota bacterium]